MMNPQIKEEWIKRLRSGGIPQGTEYLAEGEKRCCLGVLCDIAVEAGVATRGIQMKHMGAYSAGPGHHPEIRLLPIKVSRWAGLSSVDPAICVRSHDDEDYDYEEAVFSLAQANDAGYTFNQIADIIEEEL